MRDKDVVMSRSSQGQRLTDNEMQQFKQSLAQAPQQGPANYVPSPSAGLQPLGNIKLSHAHGFSSTSIRGNARMSMDGQGKSRSVVFTLGSIGVVQEYETRK